MSRTEAFRVTCCFASEVSVLKSSFHGPRAEATLTTPTIALRPLLCLSSTSAWGIRQTL